MIDQHQVDIPAECHITFEEQSVTTECTTRLIYKDGFVMVLFQHSAGTMGFGGNPTTSNGTIRVNTFGTDGSKAITTTGSCNINADTIRVSCSAKIGAEWVTVNARGWK